VKAWVLFVSAMGSLAGCQRPAATAAAPSASSAAAILDSMDTRVAVPLLPMMANHQKQNMRDHLHAVQEIIGAVGAGDFDAIARAAATIGYSEQMGQMCHHMGAGAPGFTDQALRFHHTADKISDAARQRDMPAVLSALGATLATCTGCHSVFKQQVVDEATWASLTSQAAAQRH
jgi:hypothetical protein